MVQCGDSSPKQRERCFNMNTGPKFSLHIRIGFQLRSIPNEEKLDEVLSTAVYPVNNSVGSHGVHNLLGKLWCKSTFLEIKYIQLYLQ